MTGRKLKQLRERKNLTRPQLAKMLGYDTMTIYKWETGRPGRTPDDKLRIKGLVERELISILLGSTKEANQREQELIRMKIIKLFEGCPEFPEKLH